MYASDRDTTSGRSPRAGGGEGRNARYAYLTGRLRGRQMTMEEATELFGIMQEMIQTSEAARAAMLRLAPTPASAVRPVAAPRPPGPPAVSGSDDFLLLGILAMGAGAGLLAAMTKRLQDVTGPSGSGSRSAAAAPTSKG